MLLIKAGGGRDLNWEGVCADIAEIRASEPVVLVHGASTVRDDLAARLNVPVRTVVSPSGVTSVYTDRAAIEVFLMAYAGLVNKRIVARMLAHGVPAVGLSGVDGRLWEAVPKKDIPVVENGRTKLLRDNLTGRVERVNDGLLRLLIDNGYVPVLCAPAISAEGEIVNTDNDLAAAVMAGALGITRMVYLFEAPGLLRDADREDTRIERVGRDGIEAVLPFAQGRMKKKILGVRRALDAGVETVYFGDGRIDHPLRSALAGHGTVFG
jgi:acetylglutamate/LysW-gamma-L-alpha-aminoadipate kinase